MIDTWLIFTLVIPFIEVILHTKMVMTRQKLSKMEDEIGSAWEGNKEQTRRRKKSIKKHYETLRFVILYQLNIPLTLWVYEIDFISTLFQDSAENCHIWPAIFDISISLYFLHSWSFFYVFLNVLCMQVLFIVGSILMVHA